MRAIQLLALASAFIGTSLLVLVGCGGESSLAAEPIEPNVPAIFSAPIRTANLADGGIIALRLLPTATGGVQGQAVAYPPNGSVGDHPVLLRVTGTSTDMNLVSLAESNSLVDYRLVGTTDSNGVFNSNLLAGPDASPGDEPPQALAFALRSSSKSIAKPQSGRTDEFITLKMALTDGREVLRFRLQTGVFQRGDYNWQRYNVGFKLCLECNDKYSDYSPIWAEHDGNRDYWVLYFFNAEGQTAAWGCVKRDQDGKYRIGPTTSGPFFAGKDDSEPLTLTDVSGSVVLSDWP